LKFVDLKKLVDCGAVDSICPKITLSFSWSNFLYIYKQTAAVNRNTRLRTATNVRGSLVLTPEKTWSTDVNWPRGYASAHKQRQNPEHSNNKKKRQPQWFLNTSIAF